MRNFASYIVYFGKPIKETNIKFYPVSEEIKGLAEKLGFIQYITKMEKEGDLFTIYIKHIINPLEKSLLCSKLRKANALILNLPGSASYDTAHRLIKLFREENQINSPVISIKENVADVTVDSLENALDYLISSIKR